MHRFPLPSPAQEPAKARLRQKFSERNFQRRPSVSFLIQVLPAALLVGTSFTASANTAYLSGSEGVISAYPDVYREAP